MVIEPRMYHLVRQAGPVVDRRVEIEFLDGGVQACSPSDNKEIRP
jgi:hypothetical protein